MAHQHFPNQPPSFFWDFLTNLGEQQGWHHFNHPPPYSSRENVNPHVAHPPHPPHPPPPHTTQTSTHQPEHRDDNNSEEHAASERWSNPEHHGIHEHGARPTSSHPRRARHCHSRRSPRAGGCHRRGAEGSGPLPHQQHHGGLSFSPLTGYALGEPDADFNPMSFLENLGAQLGINLRDITGEQSEEVEVDFVPSADVFNLPDHFLVHVSLPGAQKSDLSLDYDTETATLSISGVVRRPGINEALSSALVSDGRKREVGVFDKKIPLKPYDESASIDVEGITAKLADGILAVKLPKIPQTGPTRRIVPIVEQETSDRARETKDKRRGDDRSDSMEAESETEVGSTLTPRTLSPSMRDADEEERDYITVDVD